MRGIIGLLGLFGGLAAAGYGAAGLAGAVETGAGGPLLIGGGIALVVGLLLIRAAGQDPDLSGPVPDYGPPETATATPPPATPQDPFSPDGPPPRSTVPPIRPPDPVATPPDLSQPAPTRSRPGGVIARLAAIGVIVLFATGSAGALVSRIGDLFEDEPPNVPGHILDACNEALGAELGPTASFGRPYRFLQLAGGDSEVSFRSSQGFEWDCRWHPVDRIAEVTETRPAD